MILGQECGKQSRIDRCPNLASSSLVIAITKARVVRISKSVRICDVTRWLEMPKDWEFSLPTGYVVSKRLTSDDFRHDLPTAGGQDRKRTLYTVKRSRETEIEVDSKNVWAVLSKTA